jgi:hypothetical protein
MTFNILFASSISSSLNFFPKIAINSIGAFWFSVVAKHFLNAERYFFNCSNNVDNVIL